jgi:hypothetical protein
MNAICKNWRSSWEIKNIHVLGCKKAEEIEHKDDLGNNRWIKLQCIYYIRLIHICTPLSLTYRVISTIIQLNQKKECPVTTARVAVIVCLTWRFEYMQCWTVCVTPSGNVDHKAVSGAHHVHISIKGSANEVNR